jgi:manganese-dependent ADP-ribose/CDP-alcohol diphosphatase
MKTIFILFTTILITALNGEPKNNDIKDNVMNSLQEPIFSFGIIADVQYCDCDTYNTRYYRNSIEKLTEAVSEISHHAPEFIINLGDLIDRDWKSFKPVLAILGSTGIKAYHCLGNHDYSVSSGDIRKVIRLTGSSNGYYSFVHRNFRFIILNGNEISAYTNTPSQRREAEKLLAELRGAGAPNAQEWNGGIGNGQIEWLIRELDESVAKKEKVFMICHFPVYPSGTHNLLNDVAVLDILSRYENIISWFNGHNHDGGYGNFNMIHFVTFRGMVETEATGSLAVVEVYGNKLWIKGSGREKSQILAY